MTNDFLPGFSRTILDKRKLVRLYDGQLRDDWRALVTLQILLTRADALGVVNESVEALHLATGVPLWVFQKGIAFLEGPGEDRRWDVEGRHILRHPGGGYRVVSFTERYRFYSSRTSGWHHLRLSVFERDGFTCTYCGATDALLHCDHVIPVCQGGCDVVENLTTACRACNQSKHGRTPDQWREAMH